MKRLLVFLLVITVVPHCAWGQSVASSSMTKSPKEVVEQFLKMEIEGGRISLQGWRKASTFFASPTPPNPQINLVFVVYKDYAVWEPTIKGASAEAMMDIYDEGRIDSKLRYLAPARHAYKSGILFKLMLTDTHWEFDTGAQSPKEVKSIPERRIEKLGMLILNVGSAIRYVTEMRDRATDPTIKKNADETLAKLKKLR